MIKSEMFYTAFEQGFTMALNSPYIARKRGKIPKFQSVTPTGKLDFWFKVNGKASAIPYQPGDFWPIIEIDQLRYNERDDGTVSWYQYTDEQMKDAMRRLQLKVRNKVAAQDSFEPEFWRESRDISLKFMDDCIAEEFRPGWPHTRLYYLDEADAGDWGRLFGQQIGTWMESFMKNPETLDGYMGRAEWSKTKQS